MNTSKTYFRIANIVYPVLKLTGLWLLANLLPLAIMLLLDQDFSNLWLFIGLLAIMGPSVFSLIRCSAFIDDEGRDTHYFREYFARMNRYWQETTIIWLPYLVTIGILITNARFFTLGSSGLTMVFRFLFLALIVGLSLVEINMVNIASFYTFDYKSLFKLSAYYLLVDFLSTLKKGIAIGLAILAMFLVSNFIVFFLVGPVTFLNYRASKGMLRQIKGEFTEHRPTMQRKGSELQ